MHSVRKVAPFGLVVLGLGAIATSIVLLSRSTSASPNAPVALSHPSAAAVSPAPALTTGAVPPHGAVTFSVAVDDGPRWASELAFVAADGGIRRMTDAASMHRVAGDPAWSADGARVAFVVGRPDSWRFTGDGDLYVMNADGSELRRVTKGFGVTSPTWSPDGSRLAFVRNQGTSLCVIHADGSGLRVVASERGYYQHPRWSPTGSRIVYQSTIDGSEMGDRTFTIQADGNGERVLPPFLGAGSYPSWSPDGRQLAYAHEVGISIFDFASGGTRSLTSCAACNGYLVPAWSPDGARIAFDREDGQGRLWLFEIDLESGTVTRLGFEGWSPAWRP